MCAFFLDVVVESPTIGGALLSLAVTTQQKKHPRLGASQFSSLKWGQKCAEPTVFNLNSAVAGLKMAHLLEITSAFEFAVLTLTVPGLRFRKYQNPLCFRASAPFSSSLTAEFRFNRFNGI